MAGNKNTEARCIILSFPKAFHGQPILIFGRVCIDIIADSEKVCRLLNAAAANLCMCAFIVFENEGVKKKRPK